MIEKPSTGLRKCTLLHLLGLCAVLGILASILFPSPPAGVHEKVNCHSNLSHIGLAMAFYADNYNGRLPVDSENPTLLGCMRLLSNYDISAKIYRCPQDLRSFSP